MNSTPLISCVITPEAVWIEFRLYDVQIPGNFIRLYLYKGDGVVSRWLATAPDYSHEWGCVVLFNTPANLVSGGSRSWAAFSAKSFLIVFTNSTEAFPCYIALCEDQELVTTTADTCRYRWSWKGCSLLLSHHEYVQTVLDLIWNEIVKSIRQTSVSKI